MGAGKAQELRILMGLAIRLRTLADESEDNADVELFIAAASALEGRANRLAFGFSVPEPELPQKRVDIVC